MGFLFSNLQNLLTQPAGTLAYNLVLVISIVGALQAILFFPGQKNQEKQKRATIGLGILLALRVVPFVAGLVAAQGVSSLSLILPVVDRVVYAISLVVIAWLWNFPDTDQNNDIGTIIVGMLVTAGAIASTIYWMMQGGILYFNDSVVSTIWSTITLLLVLASLGLLIYFKPEGWQSGVPMQATLLLGEILQLFVSNPESDYGGLSRLFQIAAFPLLYSLTQRLTDGITQSSKDITLAPSYKVAEDSLPRMSAARPAKKSGDDQEENNGSGPQRIPQKVFQAALALASAGNPKEICHLITLQIAHALVADICLLTSPPALDGDVTIYCGYDLIRESAFEGKTFEQRLIPGFAEAIKNGRTLQIQTTNTTNALKGLARELNLKDVGNFMAMPIMDPESNPTAVVLLLSPYSNYVWTGEDQAYFREVAPTLAHILRSASKDVQKMSVLDKTLDDLELAQQKNQDMEQENEGLRIELAALQVQLLDLDGVEPVDTAEKEALEKNLNAMRANLGTIEEENEELKSSLLQLRASQKTAEVASGEAEQAVSETRLALEEVSDLKGKLGKARKLIENLREKAKEALETKTPEIETPEVETNGSVLLSNEQIEVIASIAQDLRQPMSSIIGYADLLLSESVGILGALQRKFLDRIKASTDRMNKLVSDLIQITALDSGNVELHTESVDVMAVMDEAINNAGTQLREKKIVLRVDIAEGLPQMTTDRDALSQIVSYLLQNAGAASPLEGEVMLKVEQTVEEGEDHVCIQVADSGDGIPEEDLPRVFSRLYRADNPLIQGVGDTGVGLSIVKALTESLGGHIQVESQVNEGSIFSACLPVHSKIVEAGG